MRTVHRRYSAPLIACILVAFGTANCAWSEDAQLLQDVSDTFEAQERMTQSLFVRFSCKARLIGTAQEASKYLRMITLPSNSQTYAFKGNKRYYSMERTEDLSGVTASLMPLEPKTQPIRAAANLAFAYDGATLRKRGPGGQTATIGVGNHELDDAGCFSPEYMSLTFRTRPDVLNPQNTRANNRMTGVIKKGLCTIRPAREAVDGAECLVIDVASERPMSLWCDASLGYVVRQQIVRDSNAGVLLARTMCRDFVEVCEGTWFPKQATFERFADASAPAELRNRPLVADDYQVVDIHANDVLDELFRLELPSGAIVTDFTKLEDDGTGNQVARTYRSGANGARLDETLQTIRMERAAADRWRFAVLGLTLVLFCAAVVCSFVWLKKRRA
ncbi:hypothetical protein [Schlesneria paludicola]|uniref:hypothetical protein n=1 Tax=Schlesneria paludicola TaxID=360056 RepID=UPI000299FC63|nr:hypothetical protein [Schlesneria paludicola]